MHYYFFCFRLVIKTTWHRPLDAVQHSINQSKARSLENTLIHVIATYVHISSYVSLYIPPIVHTAGRWEFRWPIAKLKSRFSLSDALTAQKACSKKLGCLPGACFVLGRFRACRKFNFIAEISSAADANGV